jgi:DNA polymerase-3 subunit alpha
MEIPDKTAVSVGGIITAVKRTVTKGGSAMAFLTLEDLTGSCEVIVFPKTYEQVHFLLKRDAVVVVRGKVDVMEQQAKVLADRVMSLDEAEEVEPLPVAATSTRAVNGGNGQDAPSRAAPGGVLHVRVDAVRFGEEGLHRLKELLGRRRGDQPVVLHLLMSGREVVLDARDVKVAATADLRAELEEWLGAGSVWQE